MNSFQENSLLSILGKLTDSLILNLIFLISCIPVITIGASCTAFYYTTHKVLRHDRSYVLREYIRAWKGDFKQATICWLFFLVLGGILGADCYVMFLLFQAGHSYGSVYVFFGILLAVVILWMVYAFAYLARFQNRIKEILKNSGAMMFIHFPKTLILLLILGGAAFAIWSIPLLVFLVPVLAVWFIEVLLESVFVKYMREEDRKAEME